MNLIFTLLLVLSSQLFAQGLLAVDWSGVEKIAPRQHKSYPPLLQKSLKEITLPLYLPRRYLGDQRLFVVSDPNFYTATVLLDGAVLSITGDRTYQAKVRNADPLLKRAVAQQTITFDQAEGIMMPNFNRHNVNYSLSIECDDPQGDVRCTQEDFLRTIYSELTPIGGRR